MALDERRSSSSSRGIRLEVGQDQMQAVHLQGKGSERKKEGGRTRAKKKGGERSGVNVIAAVCGDGRPFPCVGPKREGCPQKEIDVLGLRGNHKEKVGFKYNILSFLFSL